MRFARGLEREQFTGQIAHRSLRLRFGFRPARAPQRVERWAGFAGADVFANQMRLGDGHVELGRRLLRIRRGVFDDEAFLALAVSRLR